MSSPESESVLYSDDGERQERPGQAGLLPAPPLSLRHRGCRLRSLCGRTSGRGEEGSVSAGVEDISPVCEEQCQEAGR